MKNKPTLVTITLASVMMLSSAATRALAQDGAAVMIRQSGDGAADVVHFSLVNIEPLREPDFKREDLPIFTSKLLLSEPQTADVSRRIDSYIEALAELLKEMNDTPGPRIEVAAPRGGADAPAGGRRMAVGLGPAGGPMMTQMGRFADLEAELPPGSSVNVGIGMGMSTSDDGNPPVPSASVNLTVETPGGEDISPELLEKFQKRADEMAEQMTQSMRERQAAQEAQPQPAEPVVAPLNVEELRAQQLALQEKLAELIKAKARLRADFVTQTQSVLAPEQVERWPALERALTRSRSLPKGRIAGESTDLLTLLEAQAFADSRIESLAAQILSYEMELDSALKRRDALLADASKGIDAAIGSGDTEKAISIAHRAADARISVRKINHQYAEQFSLELGSDEGETFRTAAMRAFYPRVLGQTRGQRLFDLAGRLSDVPADAAAAIADMRIAYEHELRTLNDQIMQTIDREEPLERVRGLQQLQTTIQGGGRMILDEPEVRRQIDPTREMFEKRAELDDRYIKSVHSVLPAELAAELPKPRTHKGPIVIRSGGGR